MCSGRNGSLVKITGRTLQSSSLIASRSLNYLNKAVSTNSVRDTSVDQGISNFSDSRGSKSPTEDAPAGAGCASGLSVGVELHPTKNDRQATQATIFPQDIGSA